jgi:hypothetical protein
MRNCGLALSLTMVSCVDYAVTRSQRLDAWTQPDRDDPVDILWVLDNSPSMSEEHASLREHAAAFTDTLAAAELEFRLGMVDTDPADIGVQRGATLDEDTPGLTEGFQAAITEAGLTGSRDEAGFEAALAGASALVYPDFARENANLEVIVYSDEDDQSGMDVADFLAALELTRPGMTARVNAIVGDEPAGCASAVAAADPGTRYIAAKEASGGVRESICVNDLDAMLERVANQAIGLNTTFLLTDLPLLNTLVVTVDHAEIPRRDEDGWRYDGRENAIVFSGWAIPRPGASVAASYFNWTGGPLPDTGFAEN